MMATILSRNGLFSVTVFVPNEVEREKLKAHSRQHDEISLDMVDGIQRITADGVVIWEGTLV